MAEIHIARKRMGSGESKPTQVPILDHEQAAAAWYLSGDSAFLYYDRVESGMRILLHDAAGNEVSLDHSLPSISPADQHRTFGADRHGRVSPPEAASDEPSAISADRARKLQTLLPGLRCVRCPERARVVVADGGGVDPCVDGLACIACDARYPLVGGVPIMLQDGSADWRPAGGARSSNTYSRMAAQLFDRHRDGLVLDCGSGDTDCREPHVVSVEVVRYENVDVVASGDALPFADAFFDGSICEAVLEHVRRPEAVVKEIHRVLKPGAAALFDVPFMVPYHGYPDHYQNYTRSGLRQLLSSFDEDLCGIYPHQEPWIALGWMLRVVHDGLTDDSLRSRFKCATLGEVLDSVARAQPPAFVHELSNEARETIAAGFTYLGRKPHIDRDRIRTQPTADRDSPRREVRSRPRDDFFIGC